MKGNAPNKRTSESIITLLISNILRKAGNYTVLGHGRIIQNSMPAKKLMAAVMLLKHP